ncbi:chemotaxis protein CheA [Limnoglobus roseus]|uniref:Chemotaxis protein CheA n=1 Tax=Limnoglobus roseus TaxID=2598579 RepID=A0A5C1AME3_9BACT|nr:chemotaxis protein CheA [Limnoglobus roseus]QEL20589.1 chemotaxis protein CheA [Limnoglobus roseus]
MSFDPTIYHLAFFEEAAELLVALEAALLTLDARAANPEAVADAFRAVHSLKGGADAVGFEGIAQAAHALETKLDLHRAGTAVNGAELDALLAGADALAEMVATERTGTPAKLPTATASPVPTRTVVVTVTPAPDAFRAGLDPIPLLRELAALGTVRRVGLRAAHLPPLADLDPETCYLGWAVELDTPATDAAVRDVFAFVGDNVAVTVAVPGERLADDGGETDAEALRFARFLTDRGMVRPEAALAALDGQRATRPLLGRLAIQAGYMIPEDVYEALSRVEPGELFGDTAVSYRLLRANHLQDLLKMQRRQTPSLRDCLVSAGAIGRADADREWAAFAKLPPPVPPARIAGEEPDVPAPAVEVAVTTLKPEMAELLAEFCTENEEHLETADRLLLVLDANPTDAEALNAVYRAYHTLKGGAGMLTLTTVKNLAHEAENLLNLAREGKVTLHAKALDLAFASTDALKRQVGFLRRWLADHEELETDPALPALMAELRTFDPVTGRSDVPPSASVPAESAPEEHAPTAGRAAGGDKETVRVDKGRLDKLINSIGELVIAQAMAEQEFIDLTRKTGGHSLALPELSKISRDIQELGLSLRMIPLQGIFQKMARLVRDLSRKMHKPVHMALHGEETELDKTVVDQLGDPLMHMVRNAVDHGLESPDERAAAGKPAEGHVGLRAYHQGGSVYIELTDDGKGLDRDRILKKAVEKGIVAEDQRLSDAEVYALIFEPGFSTAAAVTDVSGRGVGMDVVRRNVETLQGSIHIRTAVGKGTTFTIRLPLTLAIMDGLLVELGDDVFLLPLLSVVESFRPKRSDLHTVAGRGELVAVRGETVPLLRLHRLLNTPTKQTDPCEGLVVLVEDSGNKYALLIDDLLGQMQAVVKSLDANYQSIEGLAGATILGNGRVAMILDVHGLAGLHQRTGRYPAVERPLPLLATGCVP